MVFQVCAPHHCAAALLQLPITEQAQELSEQRQAVKLQNPDTATDGRSYMGRGATSCSAPCIALTLALLMTSGHRTASSTWPEYQMSCAIR